MATDLERLIVQLEAQADKFNKALARAEGQANRSATNIQRRFDKMNKDLSAGFRSFAAPLAGLLTTGAIAKLVDDAGRIAETAQKIGISAEDLQKFRYALEQNAGSAEAADKGLQRFARNVSEAVRGLGELAPILQANGIAIAEFAKLPLTEQVKVYADLVKNAKNEQDQLNLAFKGFGREGADAWSLILQQGRAGVEEFGQQAVNAGAVLDEQFTQRAREIADEFKKLSRVITVELQAAVLTAAEAITYLWERWRQGSEIAGGSTTAIQQRLAELKQSLAEAEQRTGQMLNSVRLDLLRNEIELLTQQLDAAKKSAFELGVEMLKLGKGSALGQGFGPEDLGKGGGKPTILPNKDFGQKNELDRAIEATNRRIAALQAEAQTIAMTTFEQERYRVALELEERAKSANIPVTEELRQRIDAVAVAYGHAAQAAEQAREAYSQMQELQRFVGQQMIDFVQGIVSGSETASDALKKLAQAIANAALQAAILGSGPLAGLFGTSAPGGAVGGLVGALFGGSRAVGGPIDAGKMYKVHKDELIIPRVPGTVVPASKAQMGGSTQIINHNDFRGVDPAMRGWIEQQQRVSEQRVLSQVPSRVSYHRSNNPRYLRG